MSAELSPGELPVASSSAPLHKPRTCSRAQRGQCPSADPTCPRHLQLPPPRPSFSWPFGVWRPRVLRSGVQAVSSRPTSGSESNGPGFKAAPSTHVAFEGLLSLAFLSIKRGSIVGTLQGYSEATASHTANAPSTVTC